MIALLLEGYLLLWFRQNTGGRTTYYYYYDVYTWTWVVAVLALVWLASFIVGRYRRGRAVRRPRPPRSDYRLLRRVVKAKRKVSERYLRTGFSTNIHAVGVGVLADGAYCIQVFVNDPNQELWAGAGAETLPPDYGGFRLVVVKMRQAVFMSGADADAPEPWERYAEGIRDRREVITGGISGANANLTGQSGTLGYFCTRRSKLRWGTETCILSNFHVFVDPRKPDVDDSDLIVQPSPGEAASNRPIGMLLKYSPLKFDNDTRSPNHIDAAIAQLWESSPYTPVLPFVGCLKGHVEKKDVRPGELVSKVGRTTGLTTGRVSSTNVDIRVRYERTGQSAFFQDQFLIAPSLPRFKMFVKPGDSGSLVVNERQLAVGLIFAGVPEVPASAKDAAGDGEPGVENYGVANPISEVLDRLKIRLIT